MKVTGHTYTCRSCGQNYEVDGTHICPKQLGFMTLEKGQKFTPFKQPKTLEVMYSVLDSYIKGIIEAEQAMNMLELHYME